MSIQIKELNSSQIQITWDAVSGAVSYKVIIRGLGAKDVQTYETNTNVTTHTQSSLVVGSYYSVLVKWKNATGAYTAIDASFICRVGNGGTGNIIIDTNLGIAFYESITSGSTTISATINENNYVLVDLPTFGTSDLSYFVAYGLGSPYDEGLYGSLLFPISYDTKLGFKLISSSLTEPTDTVDLIFYPFKG